MKKVIILGSTGSLGRQTLEVLEKHKKDFRVVGLSANTNATLLEKQAKAFKVKQTTLTSKDGPAKLKSLATKGDIIVNVLAGTAGIAPTFAALKAGKTLLLGNKESVVAEGYKLKKYLPQIIPLDSEHNAIFEILAQNPNKKIKKITIPCSGGPFLETPASELSNVTSAQVLNHPRWKMGPKVTVESATLLNKGFEIIEAHYLFNLPLSKIEAKIHPECMIHGMVEFTDGGTLAYISPPDMREHIENAFLRTLNRAPSREIRPLKPNEFHLPDPPHDKLPGIKIVLAAFKKNPTQMKEFLKKEEDQIQKFLDGEIKFTELLDRTILC